MYLFYQENDFEKNLIYNFAFSSLILQKYYTSMLKKIPFCIYNCYKSKYTLYYNSLHISWE